MAKKKSNPEPPAVAEQPQPGEQQQQQQQQASEFEVVIEETNKLVVHDERKAELTLALRPIATRIREYKAFVATLKVTNQNEADEAGEILEEIRKDEGLAVAAMTREIEGLFKAHRRWTAFRNLFTVPLQDAYRRGKAAVINWQVEEQRKRAAEQARLQAEADERARKDQERLKKQAEAAAAKGQVEKAEEKMAAAESVVAPTITLPEAKVSGVTVRTTWAVKLDGEGNVLVDHKAFFAAAATNENLWSYVEFKRGKLQSAKAANPRLEIPGVQFEKVNR